MLKKVVSPMFKACEVNFSEEELIIKQEIADEDKEKKTAEITQSSKTEEKLMDKQSPKTPVKETKTEDARKKKKNRNGEIWINKSNNFAYVAYAPRKKCEKCGSGKVKKVIWIIDSACSKHMTGDKALLSQFEEKAGPLVTFGDNNKGFIMGYGKIVSGNIVIDDVTLVAGLETKESEEQSKLWYKKLSHLNFKAINTLVKRELVRDMPKLEFAQVEFCEASQKGKMKRSSHKSKTMNSIKFKNATLSEFCKSKGIVQEFSAARTPQQNGVVERKNRTLVEAARIMLQDAKVPTSFWEEAINTACYTQNRYLINKEHGKSPYSTMSKRKYTIKHFHVFGSKCYILKDNSEYVGKFDSKVFEAIFLGYSLEKTAYKVYVIDQKKIMESTDMTFDDNKCPGLECLNDNEAEAIVFENLNIDSDSDGEDQVDA
ncbi:hypothetical protein AgCh_006069 [Apium graveolens]